MSDKPSLPTLAVMLQQEPGERLGSSCQPFRFNNFKADGQGVIKLPPLSVVPAPRTPYVRNHIPQAVTPATAMRGHTYGPETTPTHHMPSATYPSIDVSQQGNATLKAKQTNVLKTPVMQEPIRTPAKSVNRVDCGTPVNSNAVNSHKKGCGTSSSKRSFAFISHSLDTFLSQEPCIDNAPLARRKRRRTSKHELNILQQEFEQSRTPSKEKRMELASKCNMTEKAVQIWFQNRRQSMKKKERDASDQLPSTPVSSMKVSHDHSSPMKDSLYSESPTIERCTLSNECPAGDRTSKETATTNSSSVKQSAQNTFARKRYTPVSSPSRSSSQQGRGQALTFRLRSDKQLTPVQISPNNRVSKLLNGTSSDSSIAKENKEDTNYSIKGRNRARPKILAMKYKIGNEKRTVPLKEINLNVINQ